MRSALLALPLILIACSGDDGGDGNDDGGTTTPDRFAEFVNVTRDATGSFDCFTPGADWASTQWLEQSIDPGNVGTFPIQGGVQDFQEETAVYGATVGLFLADEVAGQPDITSVSDNNGDLTISGPSCDPVTYRVTTEGGPIPTKTTYKAHQIYPYPTGPEITGATFTSVSDVTYQLIPGILGVSVDPDKAIIAGTAYDCTRDAALDPAIDTGKVEGVQVNIPDTLQVHYFVESFPAREQLWTSADGLWVAANVPPGRLRVEMWGNVSGALTLLGATELISEADSINIANVFAGYGDGVKYPDACEGAAADDTGL